MRIMIQSIQILISCWEVWMCYELLYGTILEKEHLRRRDRAVIYADIILWGAGMAYNHRLIYFSRGIFYLSILVTGACVYVIRKRNALLIFGIVTLYYSLVAVMDFFMAFSSMYYLYETGKEFSAAVFYASTFIQALLLFLARTVIFAGLILVKRHMAADERSLERYQYQILCMGMILVLIIKRYQFDLVGMADGRQEMRGGFAGTSMLFLTALVLLVSVGMIVNDSVRKKNELLALRDEMQNNWYRKVQEELAQERIRVHDVKQHFMVLQAYEKKQDWEKLHQYLEKVGGQFLETDIPVCTGNQILDLVLYHKKLEAEQKDINWRLQVVKLTELPLAEDEIVSLFGNLLDNAMEACERIQNGSRWIWIRISRQKQMLNVEIKNSIGEIPEEKDGELISSKKNKKRHGYGMKSVRRIVDRHEGEIFYQIQEKQFCVRITFFDLETQ